MNACQSYPSDVSDEEWEFVTPTLSSLPLYAKQRDHDLREVFSGFRRLARDYEWLAATLARLHVVAFACLMLSKAVAVLGQGS